MNSVILIGRLAKDPELTYTPNTQTAACSIVLAVDRPRRNREAQVQADFIRITAWGRLAETCDRYLGKGRQVAVHGRIQTGSYKNKDGKTVYSTDVVADNVEFLGSNLASASAPEKPKAPAPQLQQAQSQLDFDDLPDTFQAAEDEIPF